MPRREVERLCKRPSVTPARRRPRQHSSLACLAAAVRGPEAGQRYASARAHGYAALASAWADAGARWALVQGLVGQLLLRRQLLAVGFLRRHEDVHLGQRERE